MHQDVAARLERAAEKHGRLDKVDMGRVQTLRRVPHQALFSRGEDGPEGRVCELFYNMADQYQEDDAYDQWSAGLEKYFSDHDELECQTLFFTRVSEKPKRVLEATNMTMEGKCRLTRLLDLLLDGPDADWRVQNIIRSSSLAGCCTPDLRAPSA